MLSRKRYLISASLGPVSTRSREGLDRYMDAWASKGAPDHVWMEDIFPQMASLKRTFAALTGCDTDELGDHHEHLDRPGDRGLGARPAR